MILTDPFESDEFNTCLGCGNAIWPGDVVFKRPFDYPAIATLSHGHYELICYACAHVVLVLTHDLKCSPCLNPRSNREHLWECPYRKAE